VDNHSEMRIGAVDMFEPLHSIERERIAQILKMKGYEISFDLVPNTNAMNLATRGMGTIGGFRFDFWRGDTGLADLWVAMPNYSDPLVQISVKTFSEIAMNGVTPCCHNLMSWPGGTIFFHWGPKGVVDRLKQDPSVRELVSM